MQHNYDVLQNHSLYKDEKYQTSNRGVQLFSFVISYDFMVTFITIYFYWLYVSDNKQRLYGIVFALYAVGSILASPFFARWGQKRSIKEAMILCLIIDGIGNLMFFLAFNWPGWRGEVLFSFGRLIAGFGGGGIVLSMNYLTSLSGMEERIEAMNKFRAWIFWGKILSPVVAIFVLYIGSFELFNTISFNPMTYPPLTTLILCIVAIPIVSAIVRSPDHQLTNQFGDSSPMMADEKQMLIDCVKLSILFIVCLFALWVIYAQIMAIGVFLFGIANDDPSNIWYIYLPIFIGALGSLFFVKFLTKQKKFSDEILLLISSIGLTLSLLSFIQYQSKENAWIYFIGCSFLFFFNGILATAFRSIYSKVVGNSRHSSMLNSLLFVFSGIGQIFGPIWSSLLITVQPIDGNDADLSCEQPADCEIRGINLAVIFVICALLVSIIYTYIILFKFKLPSLRFRDDELANSALPINE